MKQKTLFRCLTAIILLSSLELLSGCISKPRLALKPTIGFSGKPITLAVASVVVDNDYHPSGILPNIEQLYSITPSTIAQCWADTRLVAVGTRGLATLKIFDASIIERKLPVRNDFMSFFSDQVDKKIIGKLRAVLIISIPNIQTDSVSIYKASVNVSGEQTILQSANLNDRDRYYFELIQFIAQKFDTALTNEMRHTINSNIAPYNAYE
jgi:hypothetical protein